MPTPKKKISPSRRDKRRASYPHQLKSVTMTTCSQCGEPVRPHAVCRCGYYRGKQIVFVKEKKKSEDSSSARS